ncbi:MAG: hypothetical protein NTV89_08875 [Proteobacteria bacterium]|nr:hypothetical protein [Pseudomonadota bacterium]
MLNKSFPVVLSLIVLSLLVVGCPSPLPVWREFYSLDQDASGVNEKVNNIASLTVVSRDDNELRAEYRAGFVQGTLQGRTIRYARDNSWDNSYLTDPDHSFPQQPGPTPAELEKAASILNENYNYLIKYLKTTPDSDAARKLSRLLFRMLGIYHGATLAAPASLDFSGSWLPDASYFQPAELTLEYGTTSLTFMDVYFLNAFNDLTYVISYSPELGGIGIAPGEKCSAFLKRVGDEVILTHNTWQGFLSQTMAMTLFVNDDFLTVNASSPGLIGSGTDFGYNNKGIMFNETTHRLSHSVTKTDALWIFWRVTLAEQFSTSIDDFFHYISLENSGTYLNGYMLVDSNNNETGLVEMSYQCFVFYRSSGGPYTVTTKPEGFSTAYDAEMVTPAYLMGINFPASLQVRADLKSTDNRPARRQQFTELLPGVTDVESARAVITYTDPANPLSIFGRWDLGYGETPYPKMIPDGSIDAKVATASMARASRQLTGKLDVLSPAQGFWMLYGTAHVNGKPFIWSRSSWSWQKRRDVPDVLDGRFTYLKLNLR